jgi:four helix bundle protein
VERVQTIAKAIEMHHAKIAVGGNRVDLRERTKKFALRIIRLFSSLPKLEEATILGKQLLRSGTSVGAHYREAYRSRSQAEYISKIEVGLQELEEASYWMELLADSGTVKNARLVDLQGEANELAAIFAACSKSAKRRRKESQ